MPEVWFPNLGIEIESLDRVAFSIGGIAIYWYGLIIGIGVLAGIALVLHEAKRTGQDQDLYIDFVLYALIFSIIGARLYYVIFSWEYFGQHPTEIFAIREGGLAIYGGVIAATLTAIIYCKVKHRSFWLLADTAVPSLILGQAIGRWGNFFNKEAFGDFTNNLFAMRYPLSEVRLGEVSQAMLENTVTANGVEYIQVHPTFLYESVWNLCVFFVLLCLQRKRKFDGQVLCGYLIGYALGRVWIEGLRTDQLQLGGFAVSQVLSAALILGGIVLYFVKKKQAVLTPGSFHAPKEKQSAAQAEELKVQETAKEAEKQAEAPSLAQAETAQNETKENTQEEIREKSEEEK